MLYAPPAKPSPTANRTPPLALPIAGKPSELALIGQVGITDAARILIDSISHKFLQQTLQAAPLELGLIPCRQQKVLLDRFGDNEGLNDIAVTKQGELQGIN